MTWFKRIAGWFDRSTHARGVRFIRTHAAALVRRGWCQDDMYVKDHGVPIAWCAMAALIDVYESGAFTSRMYLDAVAAVDRDIGRLDPTARGGAHADPFHRAVEHIIHWNNDRGRTQEEVALVLEGVR